MNKVLIAAGLVSAWMYAPTITPTPAGGQGVICAAKNGALRLSARTSCNNDETTLNITIGPIAAADSPVAHSDLIDVINDNADKLSAFKKDMDAKLAAFAKRLDAFDAKIKAVETEDADRSGLVQKAFFAAIDDLKKRVAQGEDDLATTVKTIYTDINAINAKLNNRTDDAKTSATRVQAPFDVVGSGGRVILRVTDKGSESGARVVIGPGSGGDNYSVRVLSAGGTVLSTMGQSREGPGFVTASDASGNVAAVLNGQLRGFQAYNSAGEVKAVVTGRDSGPLIAVLNGSVPIAFLGQSQKGGGGSVGTRSNSDGAIFLADMDGGDVGKVCVNRRTSGGSIRGDCVGQGLPTIGVGR